MNYFASICGIPSMNIIMIWFICWTNYSIKTQQVNNLLSHSVGDGIEDDDDEDEKIDDETDLETKIIDTVEYLVKHDMVEINKLLEIFEKDELFEDDVAHLRKLTEEWIQNEILGKEMLLDDIEQILRKLKSSSIQKSKLHRFKMLLEEIQHNRYRVSDILRTMNLIFTNDPTKEEISDVLTRFKEI